MAEVADTRNLEWKDNNVGSKLLQKMGWKDGQSIGKRRMLNKSESDVSSEGLRVRRRVEGLGLGATATLQAQAISHAADFASVLKTLHEEHTAGGSSDDGDDDDGNKKRKRNKKKKTKTSAAAFKIVSMPTNKSTHAKVRQAKFQAKTADDMKCIFAGADIFAAINAQATSSNNSSEAKKKKRKRSSDDDDEKAEKKSKKKDKSKKEKKEKR